MAKTNQLQRKREEYQKLDKRDRRRYWTDGILNNALYILMFIFIVYTAIKNKNFLSAGSIANEFLIHAVDVEGKAKGIEVALAKLLGEYNGHPVTYAGGVGSMEDIQTLKMAAGGKLDVTVGSALDLFGGTIPFEKLIGNL